jgi:hypothetical protein
MFRPEQRGRVESMLILYTEDLGSILALGDKLTCKNLKGIFLRNITVIFGKLKYTFFRNIWQTKIIIFK